MLGKVIHWESCKKVKFDHTTKCYPYKPEFILENETHKIHWDSEIQTDHRIPARRLDLVIIDRKKRNCWIVDFAVFTEWKIKENEKSDNYLYLTRELKILWNMNVTVIPIVIGALGMIFESLVRGLKELAIRGQAETIQTAVLLKSVRILRKSWRLAVSQIPLKTVR